MRDIIKIVKELTKTEGFCPIRTCCYQSQIDYFYYIKIFLNDKKETLIELDEDEFKKLKFDKFWERLN